MRPVSLLTLKEKYDEFTDRMKEAKGAQKAQEKKGKKDAAKEKKLQDQRECMMLVVWHGKWEQSGMCDSVQSLRLG